MNKTKRSYGFFLERHMDKFPLLFTLLIIGLSAFLLAYPYYNKAVLEPWFAKSAYYFISALIIIWASCFYQWAELLERGIPKTTHLLALLFAFLIAFIVWSGVEHTFKVLADEANLMSISQSLTFEKTAYNHTSGRWYYNNFWPLVSVIDKRPILFPYIVQIFHVLFGYSITNALIANCFLLFLMLYVVFLLVYPVGGILGGFAGMLLLAAQPIVCITAVSGGFDTLSCLLQFWVSYLVYRICTRKDEHIYLLLWYSLMLLLHVRYENMLAFPMVMLLLIIFKKFPLSELKKNSYFYAFSILFVVPRIWLLMSNQNYENPAGVPVIGWVNFVKYAPIFAKDFFSLHYDLPYATILNVTSLFIGLVWVILFLVKREKLLPVKYFPFALVVLFFSTSELAITLSHHFGLFNHPTQARLFLIFIGFMSLVPFLLKDILGFFPSKFALLAGANFFLIYFPIAQENRFVNKLTIIRKTDWTYAFLDSLKEKHPMVITDRPGIYSIRQMGAVDFETAKKNSKMIGEDLKNRLYSEIYVVEDVKIDNPKSQLEGYFKMETVFERQNTGNEIVRISKVLEVSPPAQIPVKIEKISDSTKTKSEK